MNKLITAAAGSGKTSLIIENAIKCKGNILITTYTQACEIEIKSKIIEKMKYIPKNIKVQTWFSFLLQHTVRPYQGSLFNEKITNLILVNGRSGQKLDSAGKQIYYKGCPVFYSESKDFKNFYFTKDNKIYSDKISKFSIKCNEETKGAVIDRLQKIYDHIFIDEVQDLAGYDLELLKMFFYSKINMTLVGDPRQGTYSTNNSSKHKQYSKSKITHFFDHKDINIYKDSDSLNINYRCINKICSLSNELYPNLTPATSGNTTSTEHNGVYLVRKKDIDLYLDKYSPMQMRDSKRTKIHNDEPVINFGVSKGLSFDRVLIYPTKAIIDWLKDRSKELKPTSKSKFYVALTRARFSVGIVIDYNSKTEYKGLQKFNN